MLSELFQVETHKNKLSNCTVVLRYFILSFRYLNSIMSYINNLNRHYKVQGFFLTVIVIIPTKTEMPEIFEKII